MNNEIILDEIILDNVVDECQETICVQDTLEEDTIEVGEIVTKKENIGLNSLDFLPYNGQLTYSESLATYVGNFTYTTLDKPNEKVQASGSISFKINALDNIIIDSDETNSSLEIHLDQQFVTRIELLEQNKAEKEDLEQTNELLDQVQKAQAADSIAIVGLQSDVITNKENIDAIKNNYVTTDTNQTIQSNKTIIGNLTIEGNITQNGEQYITSAEKVETKDDYILMRKGATGSLGSGYSGFEVEKYDGENNGRLVIDANGIARVGDVGDEQPLLTRQEQDQLQNGDVFVWNAETNRAEGSNEFAKTSEVESAINDLSTAINNELSTKASVEYVNSKVPTSTSQLTNDSGFVVKERVDSLEADIDDLQTQIDEINTDNLVDLETNQEIGGVKTFKENVGIKNEDGTVDYLKHINNNFLISTSTGTNLMNIDEGLSKAYFFNKEVAYKEDIVAGSGTKVTVGGVIQETFNADTKADVSALNSKAEQSSLDATNTKVDSNTTFLNSLAVEIANAQQDISDNMADITALQTDKADKTELFSGSYNDLTDKPTIPDTSALEEEIATKLPLSGGTMTGNIDMNGNDLTNIKYLYDVHGNLAFGVGGNYYVVGNKETLLDFQGFADAPKYNGSKLAFASDINDLDSRIVRLESADTYINADIDWLKDNKADLTNASQNITANDITLQGFSMFNYCAELGGRDYIVAQGTNYVRWNGGLQICWGFDGASLGGYHKIITLPMAYANTNYIVLGTPQTQGSDTWSFYASVESTTTFRWRNRSGAGEMYWFAIGRWK